MARKFGIPVCPHAGGVGLCELVQHLSIFDYVAVSGTLENRVTEFVDHLHEHFVDPCIVVDGAYVLPGAPGYSAEMFGASVDGVLLPGRRLLEPGGHSLERRGMARPDRSGYGDAVTEFDGLVSIVTGGASGIGLATSLALAARGSTVAVLDLSVDGLDDRLHGFVADVADRGSVDAAVAAVAERFGRIDVVVNNAGISAVGAVDENDDAEWARVLDINVTGMARVSAAALPWLRASPAAAIVNVCSIAALNGLPRRALYGASKGAVLALTFAMATDHVREGIRVNCISPGTVSSPFVERMLAGFDDPVAERAALDARQATGRMVTPKRSPAASCTWRARCPVPRPGPRSRSTAAPTTCASDR